MKNTLLTKFLHRTSFKNVSGNWQFKGDITPERAFNQMLEIIKDNDKAKKNIISKQYPDSTGAL